MRKRIFLGILVVAILSVALPAQAEFVPEKYGFYVLEGINGPILIEAHVFDTNGGCVGFNGKRLVPALKQGELNFIFYTGEKLKQGQLSLSRFDWQEEVGETQYGTKRAVQLFTAQAVQPPGYRNIACDIFPKYAGDPDMFRISPTIVLPPGYYAFHNGYSNVALDFLVLSDEQISDYRIIFQKCEQFWQQWERKNYKHLADFFTIETKLKLSGDWENMFEGLGDVKISFSTAKIRPVELVDKTTNIIPYALRSEDGKDVQFYTIYAMELRDSLINSLFFPFVQ